MKYDLLLKYIQIIKTAETARIAQCASVYAALDEDRQEMHNRLLEAFETTRADTRFALWLAEFVEEQLNA